MEKRRLLEAARAYHTRTNEKEVKQSDQ
jgi:hypothetical protein